MVKPSLNLGCGDDRRGDVRVDRSPQRTGVNLLADAHFLPFRDKIMGSTLCKSMLEHVRSPVDVVLEIRRVTTDKIVIYVPNVMNIRRIIRTIKNPMYPINLDTLHLQAWDSRAIRLLAHLTGLAVLSIEWETPSCPSRRNICRPLFDTHMRATLYNQKRESAEEVRVK